MAQKISAGDLIPGLPDEISELCLLRLPFPYPALLRSVSSAWNRTLSNPSFFTTKSNLSLTKPYLVVLVRYQIDQKIRCQCLDPVSKNWCLLPQMPIPDADFLASSVAKEKGEMYLFKGDSENYVTVYSVATNSWRIGNYSMKPKDYFFTSAAISGKVFLFRHDDDDGIVRVQCYDPVLDSLVNMAKMPFGIASCYDAAVIGKKIYVALWTGPFVGNANVYDTELNRWEDMPLGMSEGWTGSAATLGPNLFMLNETGNIKVKVYDPVTDSWMQVKGSGIPELLNAPYNFAADVENGKIYVVGRELYVAVATLIEEVETKKWEIEWDVVNGPDALSHFLPNDSHILYA